MKNLDMVNIINIMRDKTKKSDIFQRLKLDDKHVYDQQLISNLVEYNLKKKKLEK